MSGTSRSANPARKDQTIKSAYETPLAGPVSLRNLSIVKTRDLDEGLAAGLGVGVGDLGLGDSGVAVESAGVAVDVVVSCGDS